MDANDGGSNAPEGEQAPAPSVEGPPRTPAAPEGPHVPAQQPPYPPPPEPQAQPHPPHDLADARIGVSALSLRYQIGAALAVAVVAVAALVHLGMVFLHVAPSNTVTKQHGKAIDEWIYPEFEQNWKLFAPNPLQQNIEVQVRADVRTADGTTRTTGWYDLSAEDGAAIDGNLLPSHTEQNELRRAWDFLTATHDSANRPIGLRGTLAETYLRRIVVLRLDRDDAAGGQGGVVQRVQVRSRTTNVPPPEWSDEQVSTTPQYRLLPWWPVPADEAAGGVR
ncbi:DUF5819 family protein [Streptomyces sp. NBC_01478]|jgi:hypothetical protein|uniref:DUF5819 family protein n=1 Tax=Streptomyces sp. NBC_01478 TaxID=2903882 RepID=UPI002E31A85B|nr:DUF5819 family protein [Streptomyces sp. NBC_01478]